MKSKCPQHTQEKTGKRTEREKKNTESKVQQCWQYQRFLDA